VGGDRDGEGGEDVSLDVYLEVPGAKIAATGSGIFVRDGGSNREISREEWDSRFPGREPVVFHGDDESPTVYTANITGNLTRMATAAGIYQHLWRPDEIGVEKAWQLIRPLEEGLLRLLSDPGEYRAHNPANGWGTYEGLVKFVTDYLIACRDNPDADVRVWR
jgi:hypothetical protein